MSNIKHINLSEKYKDVKIYTIRLVDPDDAFLSFLNYIKPTANSGHSFPIVVDPGDPGYEKDFYLDGDGSFHIFDLTVEIEEED